MTGAVIWSGVLLVLTYALPVYTIPSGILGPQPRETLFERFGPRSFLPALGLLLGALVVGQLVGWGTSDVIPAKRVLARTLAGVMLVGTFAAVVAFHFSGILTLPVALLVAFGAFRTQRPR